MVSRPPLGWAPQQSAMNGRAPLSHMELLMNIIQHDAQTEIVPLNRGTISRDPASQLQTFLLSWRLLLPGSASSFLAPPPPSLAPPPPPWLRLLPPWLHLLPPWLRLLLSGSTSWDGQRQRGRGTFQCPNLSLWLSLVSSKERRDVQPWETSVLCSQGTLQKQLFFLIDLKPTCKINF